MPKGKLTVLDVLKQLPKTNCRKCALPTCMAFAASIVQGQKQLSDCPFVDAVVLSKLSPQIEQKKPDDQDPEQVLLELKEQFAKVDLGEASKRLGLQMKGERLRVHVLGRIFDVNKAGDLHTLGHVNPWIYGPLLNYVMHGQGLDPVGKWTPYAELKDARDWARFFSHRCENAMQRLADEHGELFIDILEVFGKPAGTGVSDADVSIVLTPFPKVPILFSYWEPSGAFDAKLKMLFDNTATANLDARSIFFICTGMMEMFTKFIQTH
jgi:hypothetical protein